MMTGDCVLGELHTYIGVIVIEKLGLDSPRGAQ